MIQEAASKITAVVGAPGRAPGLQSLNMKNYGWPSEAVAEPCLNFLVCDFRSVRTRAESAKEGRPDRKVGRRIGEKMSTEVSESDEGAALKGIQLGLALCRTFGACFNPIFYPGVTAGPTIFGPFGPKTVSCKPVYGSATTFSGRPYILLPTNVRPSTGVP